MFETAQTCLGLSLQPRMILKVSSTTLDMELHGKHTLHPPSYISNPRAYVNVYGFYIHVCACMGGVHTRICAEARTHLRVYVCPEVDTGVFLNPSPLCYRGRLLVQLILRIPAPPPKHWNYKQDTCRASPWSPNHNFLSYLLPASPTPSIPPTEITC